VQAHLRPRLEGVAAIRRLLTGEDLVHPPAEIIEHRQGVIEVIPVVDHIILRNFGWPRFARMDKNSYFRRQAAVKSRAGLGKKPISSFPER
jgi:hypothetical protein